MPSTLSRLFTYAKASQNDARENFTTEALAAAIRHDAKPFLKVLRDAGVSMFGAAPTAVFSQMTVPSVGIIDLVLAFASSDIWVEVKVDAGESGNQLQHYLDHLKTVPASKLVTLGKTALRPDVTPLTWQSVRRAIDGSVTSPYWRDFRLYLEEIRMADAFDEPISDIEGSALRPAHALLRKVVRILAPAVDAVSILAPNLDWRSDEGDVLKDVTRHLRQHGSLATYAHRKLRAGVSLGVRQDAADARLGIWVWNSPSATAVRRQLIDAADAGKLPVTWERSRVGWEALSVFAPLNQFADHAAATGWLVERFRELDAASILKLLPTLGAPVAGEEGSPGDE